MDKQELIDLQLKLNKKFLDFNCRQKQSYEEELADEILKATNDSKSDGLCAALDDILERNHQLTGGDGYCPWCRKEEWPVDKDGNVMEYGSLDDVEEWRCDHEPDCAVTMIENVFAGKYEFMNPTEGT